MTEWPESGWITPLIASGIGIALGATVVTLWAKQALASAQRRSQERTREAKELVAAEERRVATRLEEEKRRASQSLELAKKRDRRELSEFEEELNNREEVIAAREDDVAQAESEALARDRQLIGMQDEISLVLQGASDAQARALTSLERQSGMSRRDALESYVQEQAQAAEHEVQRRLQRAEAALAELAPERAKRVMATALERYDGVGHLERIQNTLPVEDAATFGLLAEPQKPSYIVFAEAVGCELVADTQEQALTVRGDDPLAREVARRVIRILANRKDARPDTVRSVCVDVKNEIEREVQNAGKKAVRLLQLKPVHPEILHLVGRLKYRLSYSQNQWKHAVEVAYLSGIMAEELGVDVGAARRGGLLHDIGKAMTHDHEGSHAVLGAAVARRCGEEELVANAIGSHHNDEPMHTPVALIVTAADALSGARPGARRESVTQYLNRIGDIQRIALKHRVVQRVDIMQAGREVRVIVAGEDRGEIAPNERQSGPVLLDHEIHPLAEAIAREIEEEMAFAGQIRVTVIRESRSVAVAR